MDCFLELNIYRFRNSTNFFEGNPKGKRKKELHMATDSFYYIIIKATQISCLEHLSYVLHIVSSEVFNIHHCKENPWTMEYSYVESEQSVTMCVSSEQPLARCITAVYITKLGDDITVSRTCTKPENFSYHSGNCLEI